MNTNKIAEQSIIIIIIINAFTAVIDVKELYMAGNLYKCLTDHKENQHLQDGATTSLNLLIYEFVQNSILVS